MKPINKIFYAICCGLAAWFIAESIYWKNLTGLQLSIAPIGCMLMVFVITSWTVLEFFNKVVFQWFFIRLTRVSMDSSVGHPEVRKLYVRYQFMGFYLPLTGWNKPYVCLGKIWHIVVRKYKPVKP